MSELSLEVLLNNLTERPQAELQQVVARCKELLASKQVPMRLMRDATEHFERVARARVEEGEELAILSEQYLAPGRQFRLSPAQLQIIESASGKLAHREVTVYDVSVDALQCRVLSFSVYCNTTQAKRRGSLVTAYHVSNAQEFFHQVKVLEDELALQPVSVKPTGKASVKKSERQEREDAIVKALLGL